MILNPFVCVFLISCFTSKTPLTSQKFPKCLDICECYPAPEGGYGENTAITMVCDWKWKVLSEKHRQDYSLLSNEKINSLVIENIDEMNSIHENMLLGLSINNLVFRKCVMFNYDSEHSQIFSGLNTKSLQVLTFIESKFSKMFGTEGARGRNAAGITAIEKTFYLNWEVFKDMDQIKAIHFSGGELFFIKDMFQQIPVENVFSLTIENTGLKTIEKDSFKRFKSLKLLKIIKNPIETLDWMLEIQSPLRYLDIRQNEIKSFPSELAQKLKDLDIDTLMLGGNHIHHISENTASLLVNQLRQFSLDPIEARTEPEYFIPTQDMSWLKDILDKQSTKFNKYPMFLYEKLSGYHCLDRWDSTARSHCDIVDFNYPASALSQELTTVHLHEYNFSYKNKMVLLSGAVLPVDWKEGELKRWLNYLSFTGQPNGRFNGNVVKFQLNMYQWFTSPILTENLVNYEKMIQSLENDLQMAEERDLFVIISLWKYDDIPVKFLDKQILTDYLVKHVEPLVERLSKFKSLAAWDLFDQPENIVLTLQPGNGNPCLDTTNIQRLGPGLGHFEIIRMQQFLAMHAQIIHRTEPRKLVTITISENNAFNKNGFNHFENQCLRESIGNVCDNDDCTLDFYTVLVVNGVFTIDKPVSPQQLSINSPKPIVIITNHDLGAKKVKDIFEEVSRDKWNWKVEGLLVTFINPIDDPSNDENMQPLSKHTNNKIELIFGPKKKICELETCTL